LFASGEIAVSERGKNWSRSSANPNQHGGRMTAINDAVSQAKASADVNLAASSTGNQAIQAESGKVDSVIALLKSLQGQPAPDLTGAIAALQGVKANLDILTSSVQASTSEVQTESKGGAHEARAVWGT
jgi:hypothetical protein